jgi:hypothetical protein
VTLRAPVAPASGGDLIGRLQRGGISSAELLPIGLELVAPKWQEGELLRAGAAYQREADWHLREPRLQPVTVARE